MWRKNTQYDRPGGYFVLEPQEWGSYKKSHGTGELGVVVVAGSKGMMSGTKGYNLVHV